MREPARGLKNRFELLNVPSGCAPLFGLSVLAATSSRRDSLVDGRDAEKKRHSVDLQATSLFEAAHLFVVEAKSERQVGLRRPTLATVFEVVTGGKVYRVTGAALQRWIVENRSSLNGPKGMLFRQRPGVGIAAFVELQIVLGPVRGTPSAVSRLHSSLAPFDFLRKTNCRPLCRRS
jgi:hypothetical protein